MVQAGLVHHVATEDMDALTFKTTSLLRRLTMPEARKLSVQELSYEKTLKMLALTHEEFVDLCILLGCDYVPNIKVSRKIIVIITFFFAQGIGPKKAIEFIRKYKSIEEIIKNVCDGKKYVVPEDWQYQGARLLFLEPEVHKEIPAPKWTSPDVSSFRVSKITTNFARSKSA